MNTNPVYRIAPIGQKAEAVEQIKQLETTLSTQLGYDVTLIAYTSASSSEGDTIHPETLPGVR